MADGLHAAQHLAHSSPSSTAQEDGQRTASLATLGSAARREDRLGAWVDLQMSAIEGAEAAALWDVTNGTRTRLITRPAQLSIGQSDALEDVALTALAEGRPVAKGRSDLKGGIGVSAAMLPFGADDAVPPALPEAALLVAFLLPPSADNRARATKAIRQIQWGAGWLQGDLALRQTTRRADADALAGQIVTLISDVLPHPHYIEAAMAAVTALALRHDCTRVSYGHWSKNRSHVDAISHSARYGEKMNLVRAIASAMDEAIDQRATILHPHSDNRPVATRAHEALSTANGEGGAARPSTVLTLPAFVADRFVGAFTFERESGAAFSAQTITLLDAAVATLAPVLEEKRLNDRWIGAKLAQSLRDWITGLLGPSHALRKLAVIGSITTLAVLLLVQTPNRVTADASLQGAERRAISASYDGYLQASEVKSGQAVKKGDLLAQLDDRELVLERLRRDTERAQFLRQYDDALAARQPALANVVRNQIEQAEAQIALLEERIERTRILAPFDGYILSEDLTQRIGSAVSRGEVLFEISPLQSYRVMLQVDERKIGDLRLGEGGEVVFTALPRDPLPITVTSITPVAQIKDAMNRFTVEAELAEGADARLRPGMTGIAKIGDEKQSLLSLMFSPVADWLRLTLWRWLG